MQWLGKLFPEYFSERQIIDLDRGLKFFFFSFLNLN